MGKFVDDLFIFIGCCLILAGTYSICPVATWFVAGGMFVAAGVWIGIETGIERKGK